MAQKSGRRKPQSGRSGRRKPQSDLVIYLFYNNFFCKSPPYPFLIISLIKYFLRCRPRRAKRRPVVPVSVGRGRIGGVAKERPTRRGVDDMQSASRHAVKPFARVCGEGRWPPHRAARRAGAAHRRGANQSTKVLSPLRVRGATWSLARIHEQRRLSDTDRLCQVVERPRPTRLA
jgi:hypothetical protein